MLTELNWQLLAERRIARLVMFYKIHYHLVAITMPLESKMSTSPSKNENSPAYVIPASHYHMHSFFPRTVCERNFLLQPVVQLSTAEAFRSALSSV